MANYLSVEPIFDVCPIRRKQLDYVEIFIEFTSFLRFYSQKGVFARFYSDVVNIKCISFAKFQLIAQTSAHWLVANKGRKEKQKTCTHKRPAQNDSVTERQREKEKCTLLLLCNDQWRRFCCAHWHWEMLEQGKSYANEIVFYDHSVISFSLQKFYQVFSIFSIVWVTISLDLHVKEDLWRVTFYRDGNKIERYLNDFDCIGNVLFIITFGK